MNNFQLRLHTHSLTKKRK